MRRFEDSSRCSSGRAVGFRWYGFPTCAVGGDLDAATEAFFTSLETPDRVWSPYNRSMAKMEFRRRIEKAGRGELQPVKEVKAVDAVNPPPLYEIRWQTINVTSLIAGNLHHDTVMVRLYHSEPDTVPQHFIGHHVHEKSLAVDHVYRAQDEEIEVAKRFYGAGEPSRWGIAYP